MKVKADYFYQIYLIKRILSESELDVFILRLKGGTLEDVGKEVHKTRERIRQIEQRSLKKIERVFDVLIDWKEYAEVVKERYLLQRIQEEVETHDLTFTKEMVDELKAKRICTISDFVNNLPIAKEITGRRFKGNFEKIQYHLNYKHRRS